MKLILKLVSLLVLSQQQKPKDLNPAREDCSFNNLLANPYVSSPSADVFSFGSKFVPVNLRCGLSQLFVNSSDRHKRNDRKTKTSRFDLLKPKLAQFCLSFLYSILGEFPETKSFHTLVQGQYWIELALDGRIIAMHDAQPGNIGLYIASKRPPHKQSLCKATRYRYHLQALRTCGLYRLLIHAFLSKKTKDAWTLIQSLISPIAISQDLDLGVSVKMLA